eukprot:571683-Prymnesium_polylepis.1
MGPARVAGEHIAEGAIIDHVCPGLVFLDDLSGAVEVTAFSLDLLQAAWLSMNDWFCAWLAGLELGAQSLSSPTRWPMWAVGWPIMPRTLPAGWTVLKQAMPCQCSLPVVMGQISRLAAR